MVKEMLLFVRRNCAKWPRPRPDMKWIRKERGTRKYSRVHISVDEVFSKILKKPFIVQKKIIPHMNGLLVFIGIKKKKIIF